MRHGLGQLRHDGRDCLEAAAQAGAEIVGVVTLPGRIDPNRSGQCSFDEVAVRAAGGGARDAGRQLPGRHGRVRRALDPDLVFVVGLVAARAPAVHRARRARACSGCIRLSCPGIAAEPRFPWAILSGLARTGVTLFEIVDPTADSGAIVGQVEVAGLGRRDGDVAVREPRRRARGADQRARPAAPATLRSADRAGRGARELVARRVPADGIIDWETRAPYLYDWVRAQTRPYPGAFTFLGDEKVIVWGARPVDFAGPAAAGTIVELQAERPVVACGEGGLLLEEFESNAELAVGVRLG